jgi:hypothetical protein
LNVELLNVARRLRLLGFNPNKIRVDVRICEQSQRNRFKYSREFRVSYPYGDAAAVAGCPSYSFWREKNVSKTDQNEDRSQHSHTTATPADAVMANGRVAPVPANGKSQTNNSE